MISNHIRYQFEKILLISLGAIPGALIRWQLDNDVFINILGAAIFGFLVGCKFGVRLKLIIGIGFCGALTTFSAWITDCLALLVGGDYVNAIGLLVYCFLLGLLAASLGLWLATKVNF
tara:strand:+ start:1291 stop:1644 length:354 start_codon:yes stop_codon:yes gene_type:complete